MSSADSAQQAYSFTGSQRYTTTINIDCQIAPSNWQMQKLYKSVLLSPNTSTEGKAIYTYIVIYNTFSI